MSLFCDSVKPSLLLLVITGDRLGSRVRLGLCLLVFLLGSAMAPLQAATWDGEGAGNTNWDFATNWTTNTAPIAGEALIFAGNVQVNNVNNFPLDTIFANITFNNGSGIYVISGNRITLPAGSITNNDADLQTLNFDILLTGNRTVNTASGNITIGGIISESGGSFGLIKSGNSTLTLSANNTYTGATALNAGILLFNGDSSAVTGNITVASGATLGGNNTIGGSVIVNSGGNLSPGSNTAATLTLNKASGTVLTLNATSILNYTLGTISDKINLSGATADLTLDGVLKVTDGAGFATGTYELMSYTGTCTDNGLSIEVMPNGFSGTISVDTMNKKVNLTVTAATTYTWNGGGGVATGWSTGANWDIGSAPPTGSHLIFAGTVSMTPNNDFTAGRSFSSVTFQSGANPFTLTGNSITLAGAVTNNDDSLQTINLPMIILLDQNIDCASGGITLGGIVSGAGGITKIGAQTLIISATNTFTGPLIVSGGTLQSGSATCIANTVDVTVDANWNLNGFSETIDALAGSGIVTSTAGTLAVGSSSGTSTYSGVISGTLSLTKIGTGTLTLTGPSTFTGKTSIQGGAISVNSLNSVGGGVCALGQPVTIANGTIDFGLTTTAGALTYTGPALSSDRVINLAGTTGGATITNNGTGLLQFTSPCTATGAGAKTFTLTGTNIVGGEIGTIVNSSGTTAVTKTGAGTWTLTGSNTYTGATAVSAGTLLISGSTHASSAVAVSGTGIIGGTGTINGTVTVTAGGISPGLANAVGTLTTGSSITMSGAPNFTVDLTGSGVGDLLTTTGAITLAGTLTLRSSGASATSDVYTIIQAGVGLRSGTFSNYAEGATFISGRRQFRVNYTTTVVTLTDVGPATTVTWDGGGSDNNWNTPGNWVGDVVPSAGDVLIFAGSTQLTNNNNLMADTSFTSITFDNTAGLFVLGGTGITLTSGITNNDAQLQTINLPIIMSGTNTIATTSGNITLGALISGAGGLIKAGAQTLTLTGANTYTGPTAVTNGTLSINSIANVSGGASAIGAPTTAIDGTIALGSGATAGLLVYTGTAQATDRVIDLAGTTGGATITQSGTGLLQFTSACTATGAGAKTLTLQGSTAGTGELTGAIVNSSAATALTKAGTGTWTLSGANSYTGTTTISGGTLLLNHASALPVGGLLSMSGTGILDLNGNNVSIANVSASATTNRITDNSVVVGTTLFNVSAATTTISSLITNGATRAIAVRIANSLSNASLFPENNANTFSGGLTLAHNAVGGTRFSIDSPIVTVGSAGAIVSGPFGTGPIYIGEAASDKAGIMFVTQTNNTLVNALVFNTALGNDRAGIRIETTGNILSGSITGNLAATTFSTNGTGSVTVTGQITGTQGLTLDNTFGTTITVTLNNAGTANNYQGITTIAGTKGILILGAADQIPNGASAGNVVNNGALRLSGFNDAINGLSGTGTLDGMTGTPTLTLGDNDATTAYSGIIRNTAGSLALTKIGGGAQTLSGVNTYIGATTVSAGSLFVTSPGSLAAGSAVSVASGATLGGTGTINGPITMSALAILAPGTGGTTFGVLNTAAVTCDATSIYSINLDGLAVTAERINSTGIVTCDGTLTVASIINPTVGRVYTIINASSRIGTFVGLPENATFTQQGRTFRINYTSTAVTLTDVSTAVVWSGDGLDNFWTNGVNWVGGSQPVAGNDLLFPASPQTTTFNDISSTAFGSITFDNTAGAYNLTGNQITLGGGIINNSTAAQIVDMPMIWAGTQTINAAAGNITISQAITGAGGLTKVGSRTLTLSGLSAIAANNYAGTTTIDGGTLAFTATNPALTAGLIFGLAAGSANVSALDLNTTSLTFNGALTVRTNSGSANTITIGSGHTLTVNGNVTIGNAVSGANTDLTVSGAGTWAVNSPAGTFSLGGYSPAVTNLSNQASLDLSGLTTFTANLTTGSLSLGVFGDNNTRSGAMRLATNSTITAATLTVGPTSSASSVYLYLGSGINVLNIDTINLGTGGRDSGQIAFNTGSGTLQLRDRVGTGRTNVNIQTGVGTTTTYTADNRFELAGHAVDLFINNLIVGGQARSGGVTNIITFDSGIFDVSTVRIGLRAGATATGSAHASTWSIGGGTVTIGSGGLEMATNTATGATANVLSSTVTISGGNVTIGNSVGLGAAIRLANNSAASGGTTANGALNITGGTVNVAGDIILGATTRPATAALTLSGGTLFMNNHLIGSGTNIVTFNAQSGTLSDLAELNAGGVFTKSTLGSLTLAGTNTYTGSTVINAGTLLVTGTTAASSAVVVNNSGTLAGTGTVNGSVTLNSGSDLAPGPTGTTLGTLTVGANAVTMNSSSAFAVNLDGAAPTAEQLTASGPVTCAGSLIVSSLVNPAPGTVYTILTAPAITGTFAGLPDGTAYSQQGRTFTINYIPFGAPTSVTLTEGVRLATRTWVGLGTDANWTTAENWAGNILPIVGDDLIFDGNLNLIPVNDYPNGSVFSSITFAANAGVFRLDGNRVTVNSLVSNVSALGQSITMPLDLSGNPAINTANADMTLTGVIAGTSGFIKQGANTLTVTATNTYTGATVVSAGTMIASGAIVSSAITVASGATMIASAAITTPAISIASGGVFTFQVDSGIRPYYAALPSPNQITGAGTLRKTGLGALDLSTNGFGTTMALSSGALIDIQAGILRNGQYQNSTWTNNLSNMTIAAGASFDTWNGAPVRINNLNGAGSIINGFASGTTLTMGVDNGIGGNFTGNITAIGLGLVKDGTGTQTLSGTNTYTGTTTINAGILKLGSTNALPGGALSMPGFGILDLNGFNASVSNISSSLPSATIIDNAVSAGTSTLNITAFTTLIYCLIKDGPTRQIRVRITNANTNTSIFALASFNTFSGGMVLANHVNGTRNWITAAVTGTPYGTGPITVGELATDKASFSFSNAATNALVTNNIIVNSALGTDVSGSTRNDAAGVTLSGTITANLADARFRSNNAAGTITLTGQVTCVFGLSTATSATNTVTLNNAGVANNYAGTTTIVSATTLRLGRADQIPHGVGKGNVLIDGTLNLNGFNETINGLGFTTTGGIVDNMSGTPTLTLGDNDAIANFSGVIRNTAGTLAVTKIGTGTQTLSGINTYTGATTINAGTLLINGSTTIGSNMTIASGATLGGTGTINGPITMSAGSILAPGNGGTNVGFLTTPSLAFNGTTMYQVDLDGSSTSAERLQTAGTVTCAGFLTVTSTTNSAPLTIYTIIDAIGGVSGEFFGLPIGATFTQAGRTFEINYTATTVTLRDRSTPIVWSGLGLDNLWTNGENWVGLNPPVAGNDLQFPASPNTTPDNDFPAGTVFGSITFTAGAYTLTGNQITLSDQLTNNSAADQIIALPLIISTARVVDAASGNITISGIISGTGSLNKSGVHSLTLTAANTFTGTTTITAGTLVLQSTYASPAHSIAANAILELNVASGTSDYATTTFSGAGTLRKTGTGTALWGTTAATFALASGSLIDLQGGILVGGSNANEVWTGNLSSINVEAGAIFSGVEANVRVDVISGTGAIYSGWTGAGYLTFTYGVNNGSGTFPGSLGDDKALGNFTKIGSGTQTLTGTNTYTGTTAINAGTLQLGSAGALPPGTLSMAGTGILDLNGFNASVTNVSASVNTATITDNAAGTGTSVLNITAFTTTIASLILDGPTRDLAVRVSNNLSSSQIFPGASANTFSGGLTLAHNAATGTRMRVTEAITTVGAVGAIISCPYGTGIIYLGEAATDKAGILFSAGPLTNALYNDLVINTALGNDAPGIRIETTGVTLFGNITASLAPITFSTGGTGSVTVTGQITGSQGLTLDNTNGTTITVTLNNTGTANNYQGATTIAGTKGFLVLGAADQIPNGVSASNVVNNGAFHLSGFNDTINGLSGTGTLNGLSGTPTLTLGDNNATATFTGIITDTAGALAINKIGTGTQTFGGVNDYSGATGINGGTLFVTGVTNVSSAVTIANGATLGGTGSVNGAVTVDAGGILAPGTGSTTLGTLTVGSITPNPSLIYSVDLDGSAPTSDQLFSTGTIDCTGRLTIASVVRPTRGNVYTIVNAGVRNGFFTDFAPDSTVTIFGRPYLVTYTATDDVTLTDQAESFVWNGNGSDNLWTNGANWVGGSAPSAGSDLVFAVSAQPNAFNDFVGVSFGNITWDGTAGSINLIGNALSLVGDLTNASGLAQSIALPLTCAFTTRFDTGSGDINVTNVISGTGGLTKLGSGALVLSNTNTYTGATIVSVGTLRGGALNSVPSTSAVTLAGGTIFDLNGFDDTVGSVSGTGNITLGSAILTMGGDNSSTTVSGIINGNGSLTKAGTGTLTLSGINTYLGVTTITAGTVITGNAAAFGDVSNGTTVLSGATLDINGFNLSTESVTISGTGVGGVGALINNGASQANALQYLTLNADATVGGTGRFDVRFVTTPLTTAAFTGNGFTLTKIGTNQFSLHDITMTTVGNIVVNGGIFASELGTVLGAGGTITLNNGSSLQLWRNTSCSRPIIVNGNATITSISLVSSSSSPITINGGILTCLASGTTFTLSGNIDGAGSLVKTGATELILSGTNGYTGPTTVSAGSLFVNGSTTVASNTITVAAAATLGGTGTIAGMINLVGASTIAPGTGGTTLGTLTTGRVNFINLSVMNIDLDGLASSSDAISSSGIINCTGILNVTSVTNPILNKVYTILSTSSLSGTFASKAENSIFTSQGRSFRINYTSTAVILTDVTTSVVWSGIGANGLWTTGTNWVGNIAPVTGNDVVFAGTNTTPATNNTNTAGMAFGSLTFDATAGAFTLSGNQITLGSSLTNNSATTQIITMPIDITAARTIDTASGNIDLNAIVSGSGGITKAGNGTLTLGAANNYTGTTTVNAGNLLLRGSITGGGTVTVNTTGILSGDGVITGAVTVANGGSIIPGIGGNTLATLATGAMTFANGATYVVDINGVNSDVITATGAASIDGTLTIASVNNPGLNTYIIVTASSVTGTFTGLPEGAVINTGGRNYQINYLATQITLTDIGGPTITTVAPSVGPLAGGTLVTITGTLFTAGATVTFGGAPATGVTVVNSTTITATTPAGAQGPVTVVVTTFDLQVGSRTNGFYYQGPTPTVTSVTLNMGVIAGGTAVTITGSGFMPGANVSFGLVPATAIVVVNSTTITATTPAGTVGPVTITVTNTDLLFGSLVDGYYYQDAAPTVTTVSPNISPLVGGAAITITGTGFVPGATVSIGGNPATSVIFISTTNLTAVTPAGVAGPHTLIVTNPDGQTGNYSPFIIQGPAPTITALDVPHGPTKGNRRITVTGTGFRAGATLTIGGAPATVVTVVSATTITAVTPPGTSGKATVTVTNDDLQSGSLVNGYEYYFENKTEATKNCGFGTGFAVFLLLLILVMRLSLKSPQHKTAADLSGRI